MFDRLKRFVARRARFKKSYNDFRRDDSGAAAIEFAMLALPFLALLFAVMEIALLFLGNLMLEHAVVETSRLIRTGQAQSSGFSQEDFRDEVCSHVVAVFDCSSGLKILVQSYEEFSDVEDPDPLDGDGNLKDSFDFDMGGEEDIILVRAFYEWSSLTLFPQLAIGFSSKNMSNGNTLLSASATFRNEPFGE